MPINLVELLDGDSTEISESLYLPSSLDIDIIINKRRFLRAGFIETDTGTYDTNIHQGAHAGSSTPSEKGSTSRYVRIT